MKKVILTIIALTGTTQAAFAFPNDSISSGLNYHSYGYGSSSECSGFGCLGGYPLETKGLNTYQCQKTGVIINRLEQYSRGDFSYSKIYYRSNEPYRDAMNRPLIFTTDYYSHGIDRDPTNGRFVVSDRSRRGISIRQDSVNGEEIDFCDEID